MKRAEVVKETAKYRWIRVEDRRFKTGWRPPVKVKRDPLLEMWGERIVDTYTQPNVFLSLLAKKGSGTIKFPKLSRLTHGQD